MAKTAYSKNLAEVQAEIKKYGDFKGKFRGVEDRAVAENRDLKKKIAGQKFRIHSRPKTFRENTVWSVFDGVVKKLMAEKKTDQLSGTQIFDACKVADWSSVSRAKYTLDKAPADGWILSVIAASTTSKYRVLERIAADT